MTTGERIEANANLTLWCVHVLGPDDVLAAPSHMRRRGRTARSRTLRACRTGSRRIGEKEQMHDPRNHFVHVPRRRAAAEIS